jgi:hypothetical protein
MSDVDSPRSDAPAAAARGASDEEDAGAPERPHRRSDEDADAGRKRSRRDAGDDAYDAKDDYDGRRDAKRSGGASVRGAAPLAERSAACAR